MTDETSDSVVRRPQDRSITERLLALRDEVEALEVAPLDEDDDLDGDRGLDEPDEEGLTEETELEALLLPAPDVAVSGNEHRVVADLSWEPSTGEDEPAVPREYTAVVERADDAEGGAPMTQRVLEPGARFEPLEPDTAYVAYYSSGDYESARAAFTTGRDTTVPQRVTGVAATPGAESVSLAWAEVPDADVRDGNGTYQAQAANDANFGVALVTEKISGTAHVFTPLVPGSPWYFRVRAIDRSGNVGEWSDVRTAVPESVASGPPDPPTSSPTPVLSGGPSFLHARWAAQGAVGVTYEVHVGTSATFVPAAGTKVAETDATYAYVRQSNAAGAALAYGTTYFVRLVAKNPGGVAPAGDASNGQALIGLPAADLGANAVIAGKIHSGAVSFRELLIGSVENLIQNPSGASLLHDAATTKPWAINGTGLTNLQVLTSAANKKAIAVDPVASTAAQLLTNWSVNTYGPAGKITVNEGDTHYVEVKVRALPATGNGVARRVRIRCFYRNAGGTAVGSFFSAYAEPPLIGLDDPEPLILQAGSTRGREAVGNQPAVASNAAPAGTTHMTIDFEIETVGTGTARLAFSDAYARRIADTVMIGDGAVNAAKIAADSVLADHVLAGEIKAEHLEAVMLLASKIATAATGRRLELDSTGLFLHHEDPTKPPHLELPNDETKSAVFRGMAFIETLTVATLTTLQESELAEGASMELLNSIAAPSAPPSAALSWDQVSSSTSGALRGFAFDGAHYWTLSDWTGNGSQAMAVRFDAAGAQVGAYYLEGNRDSAKTLHGVAVGKPIAGGPAYLYALFHLPSINQYQVVTHEITPTGITYRALAGFSTAVLDGAKPGAAIGYDAVSNQVMVAQSRGTSAGAVINRLPMSSNGYSPVPSGAVTTTVPAWNTAFGGISFGTHDFTLETFVIADRGSADYRVYNNAGSALPDKNFPHANPGQPNKIGFVWNGTNFEQYSTGLRIKLESGNKWEGPATKSWYAAYTWAKVTAGVTDAETTRSSVLTFTMKKRAKLTLSASGTLPAGGPTHRGWYLRDAAPGTAPAMARQGYTTGTSLLVTNAPFTPLNDPATNGFGAGVAAKVISQALDAVGPVVDIRGSGISRLPGQVPIGGIIMWSGTIASIPLNWALCDGGTKTIPDWAGGGTVVVPDLRGRFIVGASQDAAVATPGGAAYGKGQVGGADTVVLDDSHIPPSSHNHTLGFEGTGNTTTGGTSYRVTDINNQTPGGGDNWTATTSTKTTYAGSAAAHENRPRWFALAYIQRIA